MNSDIKYITKHLNKSNAHFVEVKNHDTNEVLESRLYEKNLRNTYDNDFQVFFKTLYDEGARRIVITPFRNNGTSRLKMGEAKNIEFNSSSVVGGGAGASHGNSEKPGTNYNQPQMPQQQPMNQFSQNQQHGMMSPQMLDTHVKAQRYDEVSKKNDRLENELSDLKKKYDDLKDKNLEYEIGSKGKPGTIEKLIEAVASNKDLIPMLLSMKGGGQMPQQSQNQGMSGAQDENLSPMTNVLINHLRNNSLSDGVLLRLIVLADNYQTNNSEFINQVDPILKPFVDQLKQQQQQQ